MYDKLRPQNKSLQRVYRMRLLAIIALGLIIGFLLTYGTISPCGILRESIRKHDAIAAHLPDSWLEAVMDIKIGVLSPGQCIAILAGVWGPPSATQNSALAQTSTEASKWPAQAQSASVKVKAAINKCREDRLDGVLKTFVASANCSNQKIFEIYFNANYPYMDLIGQLTTKRLETAEKIDAGKLTEAEAQLEFATFATYLTDLEHQRNAGHNVEVLFHRNQ